MKKKIKEGEMEGAEGGMEVRVKQLMEEISWTEQGGVDFRAGAGLKLNINLNRNLTLHQHLKRN